MYDELVKSLRCCFGLEEPAVTDCENCMMKNKREEYNYEGCCDALGVAAADAIEELATNYDAATDIMKHQTEYIEELERERDSANEAATALYGALPKWIPVTERLPEKELEIYWICTDSGYQCECRWTNNMYGLGESDRWRWHIMDKPQYQKVVAWRELPDPYEPPKEET